MAVQPELKEWIPKSEIKLNSRQHIYTVSERPAEEEMSRCRLVTSDELRVIVPAGMPAGIYPLVVSVNGIASNVVNFTVVAARAPTVVAEPRRDILRRPQQHHRERWTRH